MKQCFSDPRMKIKVGLVAIMIIVKVIVTAIPS